SARRDTAERPCRSASPSAGIRFRGDFFLHGADTGRRKTYAMSKQCFRVDHIGVAARQDRQTVRRAEWHVEHTEREEIGAEGGVVVEFGDHHPECSYAEPANVIEILRGNLP